MNRNYRQSLRKRRYHGSSFESLVNIVNVNRRPIKISGQAGEAVMLSVKQWNNIKETLYLTSIPGFAESVKEAEKEDINEMPTTDDIQWK